MKVFVLLDVPDWMAGDDVAIYWDGRGKNRVYERAEWRTKLRPYQKSACEFCKYIDKKKEEYPCNRCQEIHASTEDVLYFEKKEE